ncbi:MAG: methyl-accepting chemotaxis protein, partial [Gammaproteobacteria bacterium]
NAALVEEASAAAESMRDQAGNLSTSVGAFTLTEDGTRGSDHSSERRGPNRAVNVARIAPNKPAAVAPKAKPTAAPARRVPAQATGTNDNGAGEWESF